MDPRLLAARQTLAQGRPKEAEAQVWRLLDERPSDRGARLLLAEIMARTGREVMALTALREIVREDPSCVEAHLGLASTYLSMRQPREATESLEQAVAVESKDPILLRRLGIALYGTGQPDLAERAFRRALALAPESADSYADLGQIMLLRGDFVRAVEFFEQAVERRAGSAPYETLLGQSLIEADRHAESEAWLRRAIEDDPDHGPAWAALGVLLKQIGRFDEAIRALDRAIALQSRRGALYLERSTCAPIGPSDRSFVARMSELVKARDLPPEDRRALYYALGKAFDDLGEYGRAMGHFDEANEIARELLRASGRAFDPESVSSRIDAIIADFPEARFRNAARSDDVPLFIVGMVRSGTTLVEQIVSRHPEVVAGGELTFWTERAQTILRERGSGPEAIRQMREEYLELLAGVGPGAAHVTDKMPGNFVALGLIHLAFPGARMVVCRRNAVDNALSIYTTAFRTGHAYVHDRDDIVFFVRQFERLIRHWCSVLPPNRFLEVRYEDVATQQEITTRRILDFCGLEWHDACLRPEKNERTVRTPSQWQVRQPIYGTSVDRWRRYEPWLGSFRRLLDESSSTCL